MEMVINKEAWRMGNAILADIGQSRLINFTVVLLNADGPFGTCVLVLYNGKKYFLTAAHVAEKIGKDGFEEIGIAIKPDNFLRFPLLRSAEKFNAKFWDSKFKESDLETNPFCRDLAIIEIPAFLEADISATKEFLKLPMHLEDLPLENMSYFGQGLVIVNGAPQMTTFGIVLNEKTEKDGIDYYLTKAMNETWGSKNLNEKCICDFGGYSGGGLFFGTKESIFLAGIAYYQDRTTLGQGYVSINFHGPKSIHKFFQEQFPS